MSCAGVYLTSVVEQTLFANYMSAICGRANSWVWNLTVQLSMGCLASAALFQDLPTVSNSSTVAKGSVCHCKFAADEAYSVMCVPVQNSDCRR